MKGCYDVIIQIPGIGIFFAWQILCDVLECKILGSNTDNQWTTLGPGAQKGLRRIFSLETNTDAEELYYTRILRDLCSLKGPKSGFEALGAKFPTILHKPLSLKNIEHAFCEYEKYFCLASNYNSKGRAYSQEKSRSYLDTESQKCGLCCKKAKHSELKFREKKSIFAGQKKHFLKGQQRLFALALCKVQFLRY